MNKAITIYGSCVSREPFNENLLLDSDLKIETYIQKNSIITLFDEKFEISMEDIAENTNFLKRMTFYDFNKKVIEILKNNPTDYLIVDFCELRFGIIRLEFNNHKTSLTNCDVTRNTVNSIKDRYSPEELKITFGEEPYWYNTELLNKYVDEFYDFIKRIYPPEKIILIKAINCFEYLGDDGTLYPYENLIKLIKENSVISQATERFYNNFDQKITYIKFPPDVIGDKDHKLGFSALHYEPSCYRYLSECLYEIIFNNKDQNYIDYLYEEYNSKQKKEKLALRIKTSIARNKGN